MSSDIEPGCELPKKLEVLVASLATNYGKTGKTVLQRVLVNSRFRVHEKWSYDNYNGGRFGHAIYFQVPSIIYHEIFETLDGVSEEICKGINRISNVQDEYVEQVFLELQEDASLENWRENSGALLAASVAIVASQDKLQRLWKPTYLRLFLSHKACYKTQTSAFKEAMEDYGVSCFVAHEDIEPTKEWQSEIENALFSMDSLAALMTEDFADSRWTDQEVGVAIGRRVPVIPIRLGADPYGFIGKFQGLSGAKKDTRQLASEVYDLLWKKPELKARLTESLVTRFEAAQSFAHANTLMSYVNRIDNAPPNLIDRLEAAPTRNSQLAGATHVKAKLPSVVKRLRGK